MAERSEKAAHSLSRREFLTRASLGLAAAATFTAMARNLPFSPLKRSASDGFSGHSMFTPRPGSRLRSWGKRLEQFRLR